MAGKENGNSWQRRMMRMRWLGNFCLWNERPSRWFFVSIGDAQAKQKLFPKPWRRESPRRALVSIRRCTSTDPRLWNMIVSLNTHAPVCQRRVPWTSTPLSNTPWQQNRPWNWSKTATLWSLLLISSPTSDRLRLPLRNCTTLNAKRSTHSSLLGDWRRAMCDWAKTMMPLMLPTESVLSKLTNSIQHIAFRFLGCWRYSVMVFDRWQCSQAVLRSQFRGSVWQETKRIVSSEQDVGIRSSCLSLQREFFLPFVILSWDCVIVCRTVFTLCFYNSQVENLIGLCSVHINYTIQLPIRLQTSTLFVNL